MRRINGATRVKNPVGRVGAIGALVALLLAFTAAPVLGHHVVSIGCDEDDIQVVANVFDNHRIVVTIDGTEVLDEAVPGGNANHTYTFTYDGGPATVEVALYSGDSLEDFESEDVNCFTPPPNAPELSFSDCEEIGGGGSITVEGLEEGVFVQVNGPTVLTITADGTYPLAPGNYGFRAVFDGKPIDSGTFDIEDCPEGGQFSAQAAPCPAGTIGTPRIRFFGLLALLHVRVDGIEVFPDGNGDVAVTPAVLHQWEIRAPNDVTVLASGELNVEACPEGGEEGGSGTPAASIPDTAVSTHSQSSAVPTMAFCPWC